jgi:hypothetical protein
VKGWWSPHPVPVAGHDLHSTVVAGLREYKRGPQFQYLRTNAWGWCFEDVRNKQGPCRELGASLQLVLNRFAYGYSLRSRTGLYHH